jgi:putative phosphoesterase
MEKKYAFITDIHGNAGALKAVLKEIDQEPHIELIFCLGDLIAIGYETNEVLELLSVRKDISYCMGNHDEAILDLISGREPYSKGTERVHHEWIASHLDHKYIPFLKDLPVKIHTNLHDKKLLCLHYHLDEQGNFLKTDYEPTEKKLDEQYQGYDANIVCFGHHHVVHYFNTKERIYLNPGSLGCYYKSFAPYGIITIGDHGEVNIHFKEAAYQNREFLLGYKKLNVPDADYILKIFHGNQHVH